MLGFAMLTPTCHATLLREDDGLFLIVMPAEAGIQALHIIPALAGMHLLGFATLTPIYTAHAARRVGMRLISSRMRFCACHRS